MPREPKRRNSRSKVITEEVEAFIQSCLKEGKDRKYRKRERHIARRVYERLVEEKEFTGDESTVRRW